MEDLEISLGRFKQYKLWGDVDGNVQIYHAPCMTWHESEGVDNAFQAFIWSMKHECKREVL